MFGFSLGELVVLLLLAIVVVGPRELPKMMRTLGRWMAKARRMAMDMRSQSGIDQLLRDEGLEKDLRAFRALMQMRRGKIMDALGVDFDDLDDQGHLKPRIEPAAGAVAVDEPDSLLADSQEYPVQGVDAYGAQPEDVEPYAPKHEAS